MKLIQQYVARSTKAEQAFLLGQSPKQQLILFRKKGLLTDLQMRAISRRMDGLVKAGTSAEEALVEAVQELFEGHLELGVKKDPQAVTSALTLDELRQKQPGLSRSQELLELRNAGSLSPVQTKAAAQLLAKGMSVADALIGVDAAHLVKKAPVPDAEPVVEQPADEPEEEEAEEEEEPEPEVEPAPRSADEAVAKPGKVRTLADLLDLPVKGLETSLEKINSAPAVKQLFVWEETGKTRKGALAAIRARGAQLGLTDQDFETALKIHMDTVKGASPKAAYGAEE